MAQKKKNRRWRQLPLILLLVIGVMILFYPTFSDLWNKMRDKRLSAGYTSAVEALDDSDIEDEWKAAEAYNKTLIGGSVPDAFAEREEQSDPVYEALLDPYENGMMGTVEIPSIGVDLPIYHYTDKETLEMGAGHLAGSSLPVGGESTHCVISAHRGLPSQKMFTDLDRLDKGNVFYLHVLNQTLAYSVDQIKVVEPDNTEDLAITEGKDYCTLLTCTPYGVNTQRLLVRGHRIPYSEEQYNEENNTAAAPKTDSVLIRLACILAGILIAAAGVMIYSKLRERKRH